MNYPDRLSIFDVDIFRLFYYWFANLFSSSTVSAGCLPFFRKAIKPMNPNITTPAPAIKKTYI
jgi:hypothetical protein